MEIYFSGNAAVFVYSLGVWSKAEIQPTVSLIHLLQYCVMHWIFVMSV